MFLRQKRPGASGALARLVCPYSRQICPWLAIPSTANTGIDPGGRIFQPPLQPAQVRDLAQMLAPLHDEMGEHSADGIARTPLGMGTSCQVCRGQASEIPQRSTTDGLVVRQAVHHVKLW